MKNKYETEIIDDIKVDKLFRDKYQLAQKLNNTISLLLVNHRKFRDKKILSTLSDTKLKNLIKRCEEILKERENNGRSQSN